MSLIFLDIKNIKGRIEITALPILIAGSSLALYFTSHHSFILFHTLTELFTVVIAFGIFAIAWSSRRYVSNNFLLIIGISYFFIGSLDLIHTLGYKGMGIFGGYGSNLPTQLWIIARYMEAISFAVAFLFLREKPKKVQIPTVRKANIIFAIYLLVFLLVLISVFYLNIFPAAYVEGVGLTAFKKISEYIICFIFLISILLLFKRNKFLDNEMANLLSVSLIVKIAAEISFTEYVGVYDFSNMLGHLLKFISFIILYKAILEIGLMKPYNFLFLDLKKSENSLKHLASFPGLNPNPVIEINFDGKLTFANSAAQKIINNIKENSIKTNIFLPENILENLKKSGDNSLYREINIGGRIYSESLNVSQELQVVHIYAFDITDRKNVEKELAETQMELRKKIEEQLIDSYQYLGTINRKISLLLDIEERSHEVINKKEIANYILISAISVSHAKLGFLYRFDDMDRISLIAGKGLSKNETNDFQDYCLTKTEFFSKVKTDNARINGPFEAFNGDCLKMKKKLTYFVALPIKRENKCIGLLFLGFTDRKSMDTQELEFLDIFALHASSAILRAGIIK